MFVVVFVVDSADKIEHRPYIAIQLYTAVGNSVIIETMLDKGKREPYAYLMHCVR